MIRKLVRATFVVLALVVLSNCAFSQLVAGADQNAFPPLDQWKNAVLTGEPPGSAVLGELATQVAGSHKKLLQFPPSLFRMIMAVLSDSTRHHNQNRAEIGRISLITVCDRARPDRRSLMDGNAFSCSNQ